MEKATIVPYDPKTRKVVSGEQKFTVNFNPETYTITHGLRAGASFNSNNTDHSQAISFTFTGKKASTLSADLIFDSYDHGKDQQQSVRAKYADLRRYLLVEAERHAPPVVLFAWGKVSFVGYITTLDETFTMFSDTGVPVRAKLKLSISGCTTEELKVIATHSPDRTKLRTVSQGETIWSIAAREYGSPELWRPIAARNGISNPRKLLQASRLVIPALPGKGGFGDA